MRKLKLRGAKKLAQVHTASWKQGWFSNSDFSDSKVKVLNHCVEVLKITPDIGKYHPHFSVGKLRESGEGLAYLTFSQLHCPLWVIISGSCT